MIFDLGNVYFAIQLILAEIIFVNNFPKRKGFWWKLPLVIIGCVGLSFLFPMPTEIKYNAFYSLLRFLTIFALTVGGSFILFDVKFPSVFYACVAGYAAQHILYHVSNLISKSDLFKGFYIQNVLTRNALIELTFMIPIYVAIYFVFGRFAAKNNAFKESDIRFSLTSIVTIFICVGLSRFTTLFGERGVISVSIYAIVACLLALYIQIILASLVASKHEAETVKLMLAEFQKQYDISKENMDLLNIKYHDLKHRLQDFEDRLTPEEIRSIKDVLRAYGHVAHSGSDILDVVLMQKKHRSEELGVELTYLGDASSLSFMSIPDVYALFENALSNAIEAVAKVQEPQKRIVDMTISRKGDLLAIDVTNYYEGEIKFENGLPVTSKIDEPGYHGFGTLSMKKIVEKYKGKIDFSFDKGIFYLHIYFMLSE